MVVKHRVTQVRTDMCDRLYGMELMADVKLVYVAARINELVVNHGLFELRMGRLAREWDLQLSTVENGIRVLSNKGLLIYDNELVFVPAIPIECSFASYSYRLPMVIKSLRKYGPWRSMTGGTNKAMIAWVSEMRGILGEISREERLSLLPADLQFVFEGDATNADSTQVHPVPHAIDPDPTTIDPAPTLTPPNTHPSSPSTPPFIDPDPTPLDPNPTLTPPFIDPDPTPLDPEPTSLDPDPPHTPQQGYSDPIQGDPISTSPPLATDLPHTLHTPSLHPTGGSLSSISSKKELTVSISGKGVSGEKPNGARSVKSRTDQESVELPNETDSVELPNVGGADD